MLCTRRKAWLCIVRLCREQPSICFWQRFCNRMWARMPSNPNTRSQSLSISTSQTCTKIPKYPTESSPSWLLTSSKPSSLNANFPSSTQNLQLSSSPLKCFPKRPKASSLFLDLMSQKGIHLRIPALKPGNEAVLGRCSLNSPFWWLWTLRTLSQISMRGSWSSWVTLTACHRSQWRCWMLSRESFLRSMLTMRDESGGNSTRTRLSSTNSSRMSFRSCTRI